MTLMDIIFDFFQSHVFTYEGSSLDYSIDYYNELIFQGNMGLLDYLSLIATIITMVAILLFCVFIIKKIIAIIFRLFNGGNVF